MPRWSTDGLDEPNLRKLYVELKLPIKKVGKLTKHDEYTVSKYLKLYGIPIRTHSESTKGKEKPGLRAFHVTKDQLYQLYVVDGLTSSEIGKQYGFSRNAVLAWLHKYEIPIDGSRVKGLNKTTLEKYYIDKQWSTYKIATFLGCGDESVRQALKKYDVPIRSRSEAGKVKVITPEHMANLVKAAKKANKGKIGVAHPAWKGGRWIDSDGYVIRNIDGKRVKEHRYIMEQHLGIKLDPSIHVHQKSRV